MARQLTFEHGSRGPTTRLGSERARSCEVAKDESCKLSSRPGRFVSFENDDSRRMAHQDSPQDEEHMPTSRQGSFGTSGLCHNNGLSLPSSWVMSLGASTLRNRRLGQALKVSCDPPVETHR